MELLAFFRRATRRRSLVRRLALLWISLLTASSAPLPLHADFEAGYVAFEARDYANALAELLPLAEQGDAVSQRLLGLMFHNGLLGSPDPAGALRWFGTAAEQGDPEALYSLGLMYFQGEVPLPDGDTDRHRLEIAAAELFQAAADRGHVDAQLYVGHAYARGVGFEKDNVAAYKWYQLSAWQRESLAVAARDRLAAGMTAKEIAEAKSMARDWTPITE